MDTPLFKEFSSPTQETWYVRIQEELKGVAPRSLDRNLEEGVVARAFIHPEEALVSTFPLAEHPNNWQISEDIQVSSADKANQKAIAALSMGAEALCFLCNSSFEYQDYWEMLENIHLDYISLHFSGQRIAEQPLLPLKHLTDIAKAQSIDTQKLCGSIGYDPFRLSIQDWRYVKEMLDYGQKYFPNMQLLQITNQDALPEAITEDLGSLLYKAHQCLSKMEERGVAAAVTAAQLHFEIMVGKDYFVEIARIRAIKLLWMHLLKSWNLPTIMPISISVRFNPQTYTDEIYTNMIRATTMAMSAVIGGATRVTVLPYDTDRTDKSSFGDTFAARIARNVQHLLKMESHLDKIADPAAGSYYIEDITQQIAKKSWQTFNQKCNESNK